MAGALAIAGVRTSGPGVSLGRHLDRPVTRWSSCRGDLVVKMFASAERAALMDAVTTSLWHSSFGAVRRPPGMPEPVLHLPEYAALVSRHVPGRSLHGEDPEALQRWLPAVAGLLADLHGSGCDLPRRRSTRAMLRSIQRKAADLQGTVLATTARRVAGLMGDAVTGLPEPTDAFVPTHGDAAVHNVLLDPAGPRLIDWDRAALGSPARDLAYFGAELWARDLVSGRAASWSVLGDLVTAYGDRRRPPDRPTLEVYRACALIRIAHGWSVFRRSPRLAEPILEEAERALRGVTCP